MIETDSAPVRVAFCTTELDPGGAERALVQLVTRLDRNEWSPVVIALGPETPLVAELLKKGIPVHCLGARGPRSVRVLFPLIGILREFRPTILQTWMFHANILGRIAGVVARVPLIFSGIRVAEHSANWHVRMERATRGMVSHHVCVSQAVADFAIQHHRLQAANVSVLPNGVDWERYALAEPASLSQFGIPEGARTILGVGRLHPQKGWRHLLNAVEPLLKDDPVLHVLIIGEGPQRKALEAWVRQHELSRQIHFPGWQADVAGIMRSSDMLVLASEWEGMPNVVLEAMAGGLPIVATDVAGVAELMPDDQHNELIKPNDTLGLRAGIQRVLQDPTAASGKADALQHHAKQHFTWVNTARIWAEIANRQRKP